MVERIVQADHYARKFKNPKREVVWDVIMRRTSLGGTRFGGEVVRSIDVYKFPPDFKLEE